MTNFVNKHLSYSRLSRFEQCPASFRLHYIEKRTGEPGVPLKFGKLLHAVFEVLVLNEAVRDALISHKTSHQIRKISTETTDLVTLIEDGIAKAARGITTIEEVLRCLPRLLNPRPLDDLRRLLGEVTE